MRLWSSLQYECSCNEIESPGRDIMFISGQSQQGTPGETSVHVDLSLRLEVRHHRMLLALLQHLIMRISWSGHDYIDCSPVTTPRIPHSRLRDSSKLGVASKRLLPDQPLNIPLVIQSVNSSSRRGITISSTWQDGSTLERLLWTNR